MNQPRRREVERFIHVDSRDFSDLKESKYEIMFGKNIPIQDYNNVIKLQLKAFSSEKPDGEDYVYFKIRNVDGKVDTTSKKIVDASTVCYFEPVGKRPIYFGGNVFEFNPPIAKLSKLNIDIIKRDGTYCNIRDPDEEGYTDTEDDSNRIGSQSFLLKITYIEGNLY